MPPFFFCDYSPIFLLNVCKTTPQGIVFYLSLQPTTINEQRTTNQSVG